jgi:hypothetical protein
MATSSDSQHAALSFAGSLLRRTRDFDLLFLKPIGRNRLPTFIGA